MQETSYTAKPIPQRPRKLGFWKFQDILLNDEQYVNRVCDTYSQECTYYSHLTDRRLFSGDDENGNKIGDGLIFQISKSKRIRNREQDILRILDFIDSIICISFSSPDILLIRYKQTCQPLVKEKLETHLTKDPLNKTFFTSKDIIFALNELAQCKSILARQVQETFKNCLFPNFTPMIKLAPNAVCH